MKELIKEMNLYTINVEGNFIISEEQLETFAKKYHKKQLAISRVSKSFCECDFAMVRRDEKTQKAYCFDCKKEIQ